MAFSSLQGFSQEIVVVDQKNAEGKEFINLFKSYVSLFDANVGTEKDAGVGNDTVFEKDALLQKETDFFNFEPDFAYTMQVSFIPLWQNIFSKKILDNDYLSSSEKIQNEFLKDFLLVSQNIFEVKSSFDEKKVKVEKLHALEKAESLLKQSQNSSFTLSENKMIEVLNNPKVLYVILTNENYAELKNSILKMLCEYFDEDFSFVENQFVRENYIVFPKILDLFYSRISDEDKVLTTSEIYDFSKNLMLLYDFAEKNDYYFLDFFISEEKPIIKKILEDGFYVFTLTSEQRAYFTLRFENSLFILDDE